MDYQAWLKVFSVELSHQKPGVAVDDLDPLFLQSLYQKGVGPVHAVNKALVLRGYKLDKDENFLTKIRWDYLIPIAALVIVAIVVMQSKKSITAEEATVPHHTPTVSAPKQEGDFFALGDVSYGAPYSSNFRQANGKPSHGQNQAHVASQVGQSEIGVKDEYPIGAVGEGSSGSPASSAAASSSLDLPTARITTTRTGGGSSGSTTANPDIQTFQVNTTGSDAQGYSGEVTWTVTNGQNVQLYLSGQALAGATGLTSTLPFSGLAEGTVFTLRVINNGRVVEQTATVEPPSQ